MSCMTMQGLTPAKKSAQREALERLNAGLIDGSVRVIIGKAGGITFAGWTNREDVSDVCAYRAMANSPAMRRAIFKAEAMQGNKLDPRAIAGGLHSHDGGATWTRH